MTDGFQRWKLDTKVVHAGFDHDSGCGATNIPIYQSASFEYETAEQLADVFEGREFGYIYSRISNPTVAELEKRINALENGRGAVATASGMAALSTAVYTLASAGDEIVASTSLFGGTYLLFRDVVEPNGISVRYVDPMDLTAVEAAIGPKTRFVFVETLGNPKLDVPDLEALAAVAHRKGVPLVVDSTLTTPYLTRLKAWGVDVAVHSITKYLSGNGSTVGGIVVDLGNFDWRKALNPQMLEAAAKYGPFAFLARARRQILQNTGACLSPFNAFIISLGLETLALRMARHCENAFALAQFLKQHPAVEAVNYPGLSDHPHFSIADRQFNGKFGGLLTFRLPDQARCFQFLDRLTLAKTVTNLGDSKTLVIHPWSTIYQSLSENDKRRAGVSDGLVRVSVGIEHIEDLIHDFGHALTEAKL